VTSPAAAIRRSTEFGLVLFAAGIIAFAYTLAWAAKDSQIPPRIVPFLGIVLGLLVFAHLANRALAKGADGTLLPLAVILHGIGFVMITRLSERLAGLQTTWTFIAVAAYVLTLLVVQRAPDLRRYQWTFLALGIAGLLLPLVPGIGSSVGGARIWVSIGPVNFQPGEFAKILLALFFAGYLAERRELIAASTWHLGRVRLPEPRHLLPIVAAWGLTILVMVAQRDLGSSLLFFTLFVVMLWVATERAAYLVIGVVLFASAAYLAWVIFDHVQTRVTVWHNPWPYYEGKGYQIVQSMFAFANGGLSGTGIGLGSPTKIPAVKTDFILAAIGEELGLLGATAVLIAFLLIIGAGLRTAIRAERPFEKLLATGLTAILGVQAFIIIGGVVRVVPLTGVTLPFVSYGGSSVLASFIMIGLLLSISHRSAIGADADAAG
jgi:cell division protein FtsW (lipid II flippase)